MINILFLALIQIASVNATKAQPACETVGPRLDGTYVTICSGKVTEVSDGNGVSHKF